MDYSIRPARDTDFPRIEEIYAIARDFMARNGNPNQWGKNNPPSNQLRLDISDGKLYVIVDGEIIRGVFFFWIGEDPTYERIDGGTWRSDTPYGTIHRIAGDGSGGILRAAVEFGRKQCNHLCIDTHKDNLVMQRAVTKLGFQQRGIIYLTDGSARIAYDYL